MFSISHVGNILFAKNSPGGQYIFLKIGYKMGSTLEVMEHYM